MYIWSFYPASNVDSILKFLFVTLDSLSCGWWLFAVHVMYMETLKTGNPLRERVDKLSLSCQLVALWLDDFFFSEAAFLRSFSNCRSLFLGWLVAPEKCSNLLHGCCSRSPAREGALSLSIQSVQFSLSPLCVMPPPVSLFLVFLSPDLLRFNLCREQTWGGGRDSWQASWWGRICKFTP